MLNFLMLLNYSLWLMSNFIILLKCGDQVFEPLLDSFRITVLTAYKSKFAQV